MIECRENLSITKKASQYFQNIKTNKWQQFQNFFNHTSALTSSILIIGESLISLFGNFTLQKNATHMNQWYKLKK